MRNLEREFCETSYCDRDSGRYYNNGRAERVALVVITRSTWLIVVDFSWEKRAAARRGSGGRTFTLGEQIDPGGGQTKTKELGFFLSNDNTSERHRVSLNVR